MTKNLTTTARVIAITGSLLCLATLAQAGGPDKLRINTRLAPFLGQWWTPGFGSRTQVERCDQTLCAKIVWLWDGRAAGIGQTVLSDLKPDVSGGFSEGKAFNPEDGNTYSASVNLLGPNRMLITGCVLFICREQVWLRVRSKLIVPQGR